MEKLNLTFTSAPLNVKSGQELIIEDTHGQPIRVLLLTDWSPGLNQDSRMCWAKVLETESQNCLAPVVEDNGVGRFYSEWYEDHSLADALMLTDKFKLPIYSI